MIRSLCFAFIISLTVSCNESQPVAPKPRLFPRVHYPEKEYKALQAPDCPFSMEIPVYFNYKRESQLDEQFPGSKCWFDLYTPQLNASFHFSYIQIASGKEFDKLIADAFEMADKHNIKANYRDEMRISDENRDVHGLVFEIDGPVAAPLQFFLTDSTNHFLRGSLYFNSQVNRDSVAPVYTFLKTDFHKMIESFEWTRS